MLKALGGLLVAGTTASTQAIAKQSKREVALDYLANDDLLDNDELERILQQLERRYSDRVSVMEIGRSNQDRPIYAVSIGASSNKQCLKTTDVMAIGQQHGDEMISSAEGLLSVAQHLASKQGQTKKLLEEVTVHIVPRVNPDGFVARQRYNVDTDAPARGEGDDIFGGDAGFYTADDAGIGWDINRYHWFDWTESNLYNNLPDEYPENPVPEARAVLSATEEIDPEWIVDYHRQGTYTTDPDVTFDPENPGEAYERGTYPPDPDASGAGDIVTSSLFWPINDGVSEEAQDLSKQIVSVMYNELTEFEQSTISRYPGGTYAGIARNGYGLAGYGSVLYELSTGTLGDREFRMQQVFTSLLAAIRATATGSLYEINPESVSQLPERETNGFTIEE
ncbi:M14 family zinc carboxypeptidase [Haladaptatus pallidirubidus]|uniref:Peptidase M14 domain-containing protein n=1 Tax=Haladaptatus pallidirubidus TaxID=1008152 RepID=A0AAV3UIJ1_9EURY|nr:M14 family zinc carboxypeptidase [Haladaptatus pallidirubidus]